MGEGEGTAADKNLPPRIRLLHSAKKSLHRVHAHTRTGTIVFARLLCVCVLLVYVKRTLNVRGFLFYGLRDGVPMGKHFGLVT